MGSVGAEAKKDASSLSGVGCNDRSCLSTDVFRFGLAAFFRPVLITAPLRDGLRPVLILVANSGAEPDQTTTCRAANREIRVCAE